MLTHAEAYQNNNSFLTRQYNTSATNSKYMTQDNACSSSGSFCVSLAGGGRVWENNLRHNICTGRHVGLYQDTKWWELPEWNVHLFAVVSTSIQYCKCRGEWTATRGYLVIFKIRTFRMPSNFRLSVQFHCSQVTHFYCKFTTTWVNRVKEKIQRAFENRRSDVPCLLYIF